MSGESADPLAGFACPNCGLHKIRPSFPRRLDAFWGLFGLRPFRCRGCRSRFYRPWPLPPEYRESGEEEEERV